MKKLKFILDRSSLETIYLSFIRPILEYGDVLWNNCTNGEKKELDKIQNEAARICTGTTKLVSIQNLNNEINWEPLDSRRRKHKLIMFFKMVNSLLPTYMSNLVPPLIRDTNSYSLRNSNDYQTLNARTSLYYDPFLPSVIRDWNSLPPELKNAPSLYAFKQVLNRDVGKTPKHFYSGTRRAQILHTRLRTNCSSLKYHLFLKNIVDSPLCICGSIEDTTHYLLKCPAYRNIREDMLNNISPICNVTLQILLFGDTSLSYEDNVAIFQYVQRYIRASHRFD